MWLRRVSGYQQLLFLHILWEIYNRIPIFIILVIISLLLYATQINLKDKYLTLILWIIALTTAEIDKAPELSAIKDIKCQK